MGSLRDRLQYLFRSDTRLDVLGVLYNERELDRYALEDRLDVSRRTITRVLDGLAERGFVIEGSDGYTLSTYGHVLVETYHNNHSRMLTVDQLRPFFRNVDISDIDIDLQAFRDADLIEANEQRPYALFDHILSNRDRSTQLREIWPLAVYQPLKQVVELVTEGNLTYEVVVTADVHETALNCSEYSDLYTDLLAEATVYVCDETVPMFASIAEDDVLLGAVNSETGDWQAMISSSNPTVYSWANGWFDQLCAEARLP